MSNAIYLVSTHGYFDVCPETGSISTAGRPDTGGQTVYVVELAKALGKLGQMTFLVVRWFDPVLPELQQIGDNAYILRLRGGPFEFVRKEDLYTHLTEIKGNLIKFVQGRWKQMFAEAELEAPEDVAPALFHGHYVDGGIVAEAAARECGVSFFWTSHSLGALKRERLLNGSGRSDDERMLEEKFHFTHRVAEEARLMEAALVSGGQTVTAKTEAGDINRLYGVDVDKTARFIPPGVDIRKFRPLREGEEDTLPRGWPKHPGPVVLMGGRVAATKGFPWALRAFISIAGKYPDAKLVLFGGSQPPSHEEASIFEELNTLREDAGIARRVFFIGGQPQDLLPAIYRQATVFLMPSVHEPFGMVALEAAACGTPVLVSNRAGIAGELNNGSDCLIADPKDVDAFAAAIDQLLSNPEFAASVAHEGLETVNGKYTWRGIARRHLQFWGDMGVRIG